MDAKYRLRLADLMARTSTPALATSLRALGTPTSPEESMARAWTIEELERRFPAAAEAVEAEFEAVELRLMAGEDCEEVDYVEALLSRIPAEVRV